MSIEIVLAYIYLDATNVPVVTFHWYKCTLSSNGACFDNEITRGFLSDWNCWKDWSREEFFTGGFTEVS